MLDAAAAAAAVSRGAGGVSDVAVVIAAVVFKIVHGVLVLVC